MPRVMCVYFPHWSLQRVWRHQPDLQRQPLAITRPLANKGSKVIACCGKAQRHGVRPGMLHAEALAMLPSLTCVGEDLDADRHALTDLAAWAQRYSPLVGLEEALAPSCLFIDTTGCAACFGGEEGGCTAKARSGRVPRQRLDGDDRVGRHARSGVGAMAHYVPPSPHRGRGAGGEGGPKNAMKTEERRMKNEELISNSSFFILRSSVFISSMKILALPIAALRLSAATVALLAQLGLERIGQLTALPRDQIAERFGSEVGLRLDQAAGCVAEVIAPFHPQPDAVASWAFDDPVERHEIVAKVLDILLERLQAILEQRHCGTRLVECVLEQEDAATQRFECSLSRPAQTASYLSGLLRTRLEQVRVQAPIRAMCVRGVVFERMPDEQPNLFDAGEGSLAQLLDSLASRLGRSAVTRARFVADAQPELACCFDSALERERREVDRGPSTVRASSALECFVGRSPFRSSPWARSARRSDFTWRGWITT